MASDSALGEEMATSLSGVTDPVLCESSGSAVWSVRDLLLLVSMVNTHGQSQWPVVSEQLRQLTDSASADLFSAQQCAGQYGALLRLHGGASAATDTLRRQRVQQLQQALRSVRSRYRQLSEQLQQLRAGQLDHRLDELLEEGERALKKRRLGEVPLAPADTVADTVAAASSGGAGTSGCSVAHDEAAPVKCEEEAADSADCEEPVVPASQVHQDLHASDTAPADPTSSQVTGSQTHAAAAASGETAEVAAVTANTESAQATNSDVKPMIASQPEVDASTASPALCSDNATPSTPGCAGSDSTSSQSNINCSSSQISADPTVGVISSETEESAPVKSPKRRRCSEHDTGENAAAAAAADETITQLAQIQSDHCQVAPDSKRPHLSLCDKTAQLNEKGDSPATANTECVEKAESVDVPDTASEVVSAGGADTVGPATADGDSTQTQSDTVTTVSDASCSEAPPVSSSSATTTEVTVSGTDCGRVTGVSATDTASEESACDSRDSRQSGRGDTAPGAGSGAATVPKRCDSDGESVDTEGAAGEGEQRAWRRAALLVWRELASLRPAAPFLRAIGDDLAPGYSAAVRRPMDLQRLRRAVDSGAVHSPLLFRRDLLLLLANAVMFNGRRHQVHEQARQMWRECDAKLGSVWPDVAAGSHHQHSHELTSGRESRDEVKRRRSSDADLIRLSNARKRRV